MNWRQIYYWAHMLDECFDKDQLLNESKATYLQKTKNESGKTIHASKMF